MKWKEVFKKKNSELCSFLNISEETLIKPRIDLSDVGLFYFQSIKDKRIGCYYSFTIVISSVYFPDENTDDSADETQIPPIIDIKTINKEEGLAHMRKSPPPGEKKSREGKEDKTLLVCPFTSMAFVLAQEAFCRTPKWRKKLNYILQLSLDKLSMFEEKFVIQWIERVIEPNWTGVVSTGTKRDYREWLKLKHGGNQKSDQPSRYVAKVRAVKL